MEEPRAIALLPFKERRRPAQQHALGAYQVPGALHTQEVGEMLTPSSAYRNVLVKLL